MRAALTRALPGVLRLTQAGVNGFSSMRFARGLLITIGLAALVSSIIPHRRKLGDGPNFR